MTGRDSINGDSISGVWEQWWNSNYKNKEIGCVLLSTTDGLEKDNEKGWED